MKSADSYSLRQVVDLTGLSEFTLRGWELRYGAFAPQRSATGRRRYSAADLQRAMLLRELTHRGHRISDIAALSLKKLRSLMESTEPGGTAQTGEGEEVRKVLQLTSLQEWDSLEKELDKAVAAAPPAAVIGGFLLPLLVGLGSEVAAGRVSISQEHILSALLKERLYRLRERASAARGPTRLLIAAPEGDFHELGILAAHALAANLGARSLYLGPNTPSAELCETALRFGATHVLIGSTISRKEGARQDLPAYLHFLDRHLPRGVALWVGGRNAQGLQPVLGRRFAIFSSLPDFAEALEGPGGARVEG